jgi:hypothetical protein
MQGNTLKFVTIMGGVVGAVVIALGAVTLLKNSSVPPPKPYDVAMYDVYSDLLQTPEESWWIRLIDPRPEAVLIRVETQPGPDVGIEGALVPDKRFKQAVDSAIADYLKRNIGILELQRKFNLPIYDLFTRAEEETVLKSQLPNGDASACRAFQQKHVGYERWVELSAVGFNQDQTVAVVYLVEWSGGRPLCNSGIFGRGGYRMLQKRGGKWHLMDNQVFSDWDT